MTKGNFNPKTSTTKKKNNAKRVVHIDGAQSQSCERLVSSDSHLLFKHLHTASFETIGTIKSKFS